MITGKVTDINNKALQYANVYESDKNGNPLYNNGVLKGTTTNGLGLFTLNIAKPVYYITASYSGTKKETKLIVVPNSVETFVLQPTTLKEVEIKSTPIKKTYWLAALAALIIFNS